MLKEKIENYLLSLTSDEIIPIHNRYCGYDKRMYDYVYFMEDLPILVSTKGKDALTLLKEMKYVKSSDRYLRFDGYGNVVSFDNWFDVFSVNDIVEYIVKNDCDLGNINIADILEKEVAY